MRKVNMVITMGMTITLLLHIVFGSLELAGIGGMPVRWLAWTLVGFIVVHTIIGTILTIQTLYSMKKSHVSYFKENKLFWLRRFSGLLIIIGMVFHLIIFSSRNNEAYRLEVFTAMSLASQIFLVLAIAIHVISNVKPTLIAFGITDLKRFSVDILFVISIVLLLALVAFAIYYFRWWG